MTWWVHPIVLMCWFDQIQPMLHFESECLKCCRLMPFQTDGIIQVTIETRWWNAKNVRADRLMASLNMSNSTVVDCVTHELWRRLNDCKLAGWRCWLNPVPRPTTLGIWQKKTGKQFTNLKKRTLLKKRRATFSLVCRIDSTVFKSWLASFNFEAMQVGSTVDTVYLTRW